MLLYKAKTIITPLKPIRLAGFAHRIGNYTGVKQDIMARFVVLEDDSKARTAILSVEMLCVTDEMTNTIRDYLSDHYGIPAENVLISATHNHSAPYLVKNAHPLLGTYDKEYALFLDDAIKQLIDQAMKKPIPIVCSYQATDVHLSVNRRLMVDGKIEMRPNFNGHTEPICHLMKLNHEQSGRLEAVLINYACHANIADDNEINPDYPGVLCGFIESQWTDCTALFLQGYTGDIRPRAIIGDEFFRGNFHLAQRFGHAFYKKIKPVLESQGKSIKLNLKGAIIQQEIPTVNQIADDLSTNLDLTVEPYRSWYRLFSKQPDQLHAPHMLQVQAIRVSENIILAAANGEIVSGYAQDIRSHFPNDTIMTIGYSNGMLGYIATAQQIKEGGYEAEDFLYYFGLPGKWDESVDTILRESQITAVHSVK